ncbi:unnamed protein product, partial [Brachionus calyciflorus]
MNNLESFKISKLKSAPVRSLDLKIQIFISLVILVCTFIYLVLIKVNFEFYSLSSSLISEKPKDSFDFLNKQNYNEQLSNCEPVYKNRQIYQAIFNGSLYPKSIPLFLNRTINFECMQKTEQIKKNLLWTPFFGDWSYYFGLGVETPFVKQNCPVTKCELTNEKSLLNYSDFVIVHMGDSISEPPNYRPENQRWIFSLYESPRHSSNFKKFRSFFNMTSSYRIDSDIPHFYEYEGKMEWQKNESFNESY